MKGSKNLSSSAISALKIAAKESSSKKRTPIWITSCSSGSELPSIFDRKINAIITEYNIAIIRVPC